MSAGYGAEIWCTDTLSAGRFARGPRIVAQALYRRLITPRGMLRRGGQSAAYGLDVADYIGAVGTDAAVIALPSLVRGELTKDDRVSDVAVKATIARSSNGDIDITLEIDVVLVDSGTELSLTVAANDSGVSLLALDLPEAA